MRVVFILLVLSSCATQQIVIKDKWDPFDYPVVGHYPIPDTNSCAIGYNKFGDTTLYYFRDKNCIISHGINDTIKIKKCLIK